VEYVARMRKTRTECKFLFSESEGKKQLGRHERRREDIMEHKEIGRVLFNYIHLAEHTLAICCEHSDFIKAGQF
jgi:hypothetical protein